MKLFEHINFLLTPILIRKFLKVIKLSLIDYFLLDKLFSLSSTIMVKSYTKFSLSSFLFYSFLLTELYLFLTFNYKIINSYYRSKFVFMRFNQQISNRFKVVQILLYFIFYTMVIFPFFLF